MKKKVISLIAAAALAAAPLAGCGAPAGSGSSSGAGSSEAEYTGSMVDDVEEPLASIEAYSVGSGAVSAESVEESGSAEVSVGKVSYADMSDAEIKQAAEAIAAEMTTVEKISQMMMISIDDGGEKSLVLSDELAEALKKYDFGGIILFEPNIQTTKQATTLVYDIQNALLSSEHKIPALISTDQEGGRVIRLADGVATAGNMAIGASGDTGVAKRTGALLGTELSEMGIDIDFAPVSDVNNNPSNPIIGVRSFGSDAASVTGYVPSFIEGLKSAGVISCLKHFPGHGDTATDSHAGFPLIDKSLDELKSLELVPFKAGIDSGVEMIMTAHIQFPQIEKQTYKSIKDGAEVTLPATLSKTILTDLLRGELGFDGLIVTDAMNMDAIKENFDTVDAAMYAVNAGVNIILCPYPYEVASAEKVEQLGQYIRKIADLAEAGTVSMDNIDDSVVRILSLKMKSGLMDKDFSNAQEAAAKASAAVGSEEHRSEEWELTEKCVTLVKNENSALPVNVKDGATALVLCPDEASADSAKLGIEKAVSEGLVPDASSVQVEQYKKATAESMSAKIEAADSVIIITKMKNAKDLNPELSNESGEGYGANSKFVRGAIALARGANKKVAVISSNLPYDIAAYSDADALMCAYNESKITASDAVPEAVKAAGETPVYRPNVPVAVYMAFGGAEPSGKLPVDVPALNADNTYSSEVLFARGTGITGWSAG